ncbi:nucleotidyltransferase domain-containing protein [Guptibacillus algicola]|uniref:nucleotidyltransferase domain-containing protein n=1 Tax=Guptibacillus algicola TaxID=225844 RepID=UPI001CD1D5D0|nr:nucleotidyltransferase domain-containing protein [Alkalihalobacillus algicola]MCA0985911.1 nucleotidyltransferase domain-containing protein [Alkalihalobacillus algicola]
MTRLELAKQDAKVLVNIRFPQCETALLAGSIVRGEGTKTSDLDIVIFDSSVQSSYRESFYYKNWPVEMYVHNLHSYQSFYSSDCERGKPSMPRMVSEGLVLMDKGKSKVLKDEANAILKAGPIQWDEETVRLKRYFLTDVLDDFIGAYDRGEEMCCALALLEHLHEFILRMNGQWTGSSKWIIRSLKNYDSELAREFERVFDRYFQTGMKDDVIRFVEQQIEPYGGRLFEGFSIGKK